MNFQIILSVYLTLDYVENRRKSGHFVERNFQRIGISATTQQCIENSVTMGPIIQGRFRQRGCL